MHLHDNEMVNPRWAEAYDIPDRVEQGHGELSKGLLADPHANRVAHKPLIFADPEPAKTQARSITQRFRQDDLGGRRAEQGSQTSIKA
jgi:hypothetical protein